MKSIQINKYGGNDVIEVKNAASVPNPSSGKILVNVKAAGVNPADWKSVKDTFSKWHRFNSHQPWERISLVLSNSLEKACGTISR